MYLLTKEDVDWLVEQIDEIQHGSGIDDSESTHEEIEFAVTLYYQARDFLSHRDTQRVFNVIYNVYYYKDIQSLCVKALDHLYRKLKTDTEYLVHSTHALNGLKSLQCGHVLLQKAPQTTVAKPVKKAMKPTKQPTTSKPEPILRNKILGLLPDNPSSTADELNGLVADKYGKRIGKQHLQNVLSDLEKAGKIHRDGNKFCIIRKLSSSLNDEKIVDITKTVTAGT